ncbi:MAG TPA: zinc-dependent metalloprotease [Gemmatimonadales bacterium]|nr:zinc-dependent metalloprotease [Gemmatimonadales bacterium]
MRLMPSLTALALVLPISLGAQQPKPTRPAGQGASPGESSRPERPQQPEGPKPYSQVITDKATTDSGVFIIHQLSDKLFFEIPHAAIDKPFLVVMRFTATPEGQRYAGEELQDRVVRWQKVGNRILLRGVSYTVVADTTEAVSRAVRNSTFEPVIASFDIAAYSPNADSNAVIDVTRLYTTDVPEFSAKRQFRAERQGIDPTRSLVQRATTFPTNVEVEALQTYKADTGSVDPARASVTALMHYSMVLLPARPAKARLCDNRVGYFAVNQEDYGTDEQRTARRCYIARWRLEPKDSTAAVSDPVKPIVFYIDPATPPKWVPWLKKGIESWEPLFRAAGLSNAIQARDVPTKAEDPKFSLEDARYSSVRWLPSPTENAYGPHISDPRTGEILQTSIGFYHNVMNLVRDWYFVQAAPSDPRAARLPMPDSMMGRFLMYVVAHEVGHTLGFPHNMKASSSYPTDSLRSKSFTAKYTDEASIMDYGRFNYVAQPGDGATLIPTQGPYDYYAVNWGYHFIPNAATPQAERPYLDSLARLQDHNPMLRFGNADGIDPEAQTEDLGSDGIASTRYGIMNLKRVMPMLISATTADHLSDYDDLNEMYNQVIGQWQRELGHVVTIVGGVYRAERYPDQPGAIFTAVPRVRQQAAVRFLVDNAFKTPTWLLDEQILRLTRQNGIVDQMGRVQGSLLGGLLNDSRWNRLVEQEANAAADAPAYRLSDLLSDLSGGLFSELVTGASIDVYRRDLERTYVDQLGLKFQPVPEQRFPNFPGFIPPAPRPSEAQAAARGALKDLDGRIAAALPRVKDRDTRNHLVDLRARIDHILNPKP